MPKPEEAPVMNQVGDFSAVMGLFLRWPRGCTCRHRERSDAIQRFLRRGAIPAFLRHSSFASCALHQGGIASLAVTGMAISWRSALAVIASATPHIGNECG